jgi:hypothetical protein
VAQFATATSLQVLQGLDADIILLADDLLANILFHELREEYTEWYNIFQAIRPFLTNCSLGMQTASEEWIESNISESGASQTSH